MSMDTNVRCFLVNRNFDKMSEQEVEDALRNLTDEWIVDIWNDYCSNEGVDEYIHNNVIDELEYIGDLATIIPMIKGEYTYNDRYFAVYDDTCICSFETPFDDGSPVEFGDLAEWIVRTI